MNSKKKNNTKINPNGKKCWNCSTIYRKGKPRWSKVRRLPHDYEIKNKEVDRINDIICMECYKEYLRENNRKRKQEDIIIENNETFKRDLKKGIEEEVKKRARVELDDAVRKFRKRTQEKLEMMEKKHQSKKKEMLKSYDKKIKSLKKKIKKERERDRVFIDRLKETYKQKMEVDEIIKEKDEIIKEKDEILKGLQEKLFELERKLSPQIFPNQPSGLLNSHRKSEKDNSHIN
eukprot:TRINITY_DN2143_c0_g1_i1.p1 TRINITY_DN2143_c0_g1~~TRINITY_DN2143_c0_g1_i1.p1  ORF type:complete len:233 (-),score=56.88 TRINITY_DN2143_c0_g1_i1:44-742(-)